MQGALAALDSSKAAADDDAWSSSSASDAEEAPETTAPDTEPGNRGEAAAAAAMAAEQLQGGLVETERERQVRLGLITPFQSLPGLSRGIVRQGVCTSAPRAHAARFRT